MSVVLREALRSRLFLASVVGRLPMGAIALVLVLRTREVTGSYAAGGLVAGANAVALGVASPLLGRLMDRRGQSAVLAAAGILNAAAMVGFALLPEGVALGWPVLLAAVAGATVPPIGAALRAVWTASITDADRRHAAFSFEAVAFEVIYITGPLLFMTAIGAWSLQAAAAAIGAFACAGALIYALAPQARAWRPSAAGPPDWLGAMRGRGVRVLFAVFVLFGAAVAAIEMGVISFAEDRDARGAIGPILALWGLGSMAGGLVAARGGAPADPARRMAALFGGLAVVCAPLVLASSLQTLGVLILVSGVFIAPSLSIAFSLLGQVAPAGTVTEAYAWSTTAMALGMAGGSAAAGWLVEHGPPDDAFALAIGAAVLAAAVAGAGASVRLGAARPECR